MKDNETIEVMAGGVATEVVEDAGLDADECGDGDLPGMAHDERNGGMRGEEREMRREVVVGRMGSRGVQPGYLWNRVRAWRSDREMATEGGRASRSSLPKWDLATEGRRPGGASPARDMARKRGRRSAASLPGKGNGEKEGGRGMGMG